ncbi:putative membrane protein [Cladophialophora carrionii]|uniref:Putative membrane protein n=1 Tax=Cladophialophora carrionii TaxID=86049 RepID=A0A1C1CVZ5_9EURO|nr:putative membrane protein [Cladophialophora carrionii]
MTPSSILLGLLALAVSSVHGTALTYKLAANEKACFFTDVQRQGAKVAFYFAVQSGGSFDIDYEVVGPNDKKIMAGEKERQGDFVFTAQTTGEYRFCFNNEMSTFADKMVDFEVASLIFGRMQVEDESKSALLPQKAGSSPEQYSALEDVIFKVTGQLSTVIRMLKYFRTRENRNFSTVRSTEQRIFNFSLIEVLMMVAMAGLQVAVVRFFFTGSRKSYV